jgi:hypothetical protein
LGLHAGGVQRGRHRRLARAHLPSEAPRRRNLRGVPAPARAHKVRSRGACGPKSKQTKNKQPHSKQAYAPWCPRYSKFPVVVPSATPGYHAHYQPAHLAALGVQSATQQGPATARRWIRAIACDPVLRGFAAALADYLEVSCGRRAQTPRGALSLALFRPDLSVRASRRTPPH